MPDRKTIKPRGDFVRIGQWRCLSHGRQRNLLDHFIHRVSIVQARKCDATQPAIVLGQRRLPIDGEPIG